jgi:hypothetical protein
MKVGDSRLPRHTYTHVAAHKLARAGSGQAQNQGPAFWKATADSPGTG